MTDKHWFIVLCFSFINILFFANKAEAQKKNAALDKLFREYYQENQELNPLDATLMGDHRYDDRLTNDISVSYLNSKERFDKKYLGLLSQFNRQSLNTTDKISYDVLKEILTTDLERRKFHFEYLPINQFSSLPLIIGQLGSGNSMQPFKTKQDYANWIKRINDFEIWTDTAITNMRSGINTGIVLPKVLVARIIVQMESLADKDTASNSLFNSVRNFPHSFTSFEKKKISAQFIGVVNGKLLPCYRRLATFFKNEYMPYATDSAGLCAIPGGAGMYRYFIRYYTTTNKSPEEVYETGLNEVARITAEKSEVALKDKFDIRRFHNAMLVQGDMPLTVLENYINEWTKEQMHP